MPILVLVAFAVAHLGLLAFTYLGIRDLPAIRRFEGIFKRDDKKAGR